jgi:hypothetical protein
VGEHLAPAVLAASDELVADFQRSGGAPGVAYGIVAEGALVHTAGYGQRWLDGPPPDAGTVFRIASMTKSFTAAAVLALRDGLDIDDAIEVVCAHKPSADPLPHQREDLRRWWETRSDADESDPESAARPS